MEEHLKTARTSGILPTVSRLGAWNPAHRPECLEASSRDEAPLPRPFADVEPDFSSMGTLGLKPEDDTPTVTDHASGELTTIEDKHLAFENSTLHNDLSAVGMANEMQNGETGSIDNRSYVVDAFKCPDSDLKENPFADDSIDFQAMIGQGHGDQHPSGTPFPEQPIHSLHAEHQPLDNNNINHFPLNDTFSRDADGDVDFFSQTAPTHHPPEPEPRDDGDLPKADSSVEYVEMTRQSTSQNALFERDEPSEDAGFFASQPTPSEPQPQSEREIPSMPNAGVSAESTFSSTTAATEGLQSTTTPAVEPPTDQALGEEELAERWKAFLDDDLLDDGENLDMETEPSTIQTSNQPQYTQPQTPAEAPRTNIYAPHQPTSSEMLGDLTMAGHISGQAGNVNAGNSPVESFANRSKAGYQSPFDIPFEMRPKHPPPRPVQPSFGVNPLPRTSSMEGSRPSSSSYLPQPPPITGYSSVPPPPLSGSDTISQPVREPVRTGSFFEELPTVPRSRPSTRGRYAPSTGAIQPSTNPPVPPAPAAPVEPPLSAPQQNGNNYSQYQLQAPAPLDPYSVHSAQPSQPSSTTSRYSPQPPSLSGTKPAPYPRYSPVPPPQAGSVSTPTYVSQAPTVQSSVNSLPFQPRTSSPLAHHEPSKSYTSPPRRQDSFPTPSPAQPPHYTPQAPPASQIQPPKRSMTQSPGKMSPLQSAVGSHQNAYVRPASAHGPRSSIQQIPSQPTYAPVLNGNSASTLDFIPPSDGQEHDPLERWKGAPVFKFGFGGIVLSTFPKHVPRYATGQMVPRLKPTLGEIKTCAIGQVLPHNEPLDKFPGPLKSKSKKKEVLAWLSAMISVFENAPLNLVAEPDLDQQRRREDNILLWKVVHVLVEYDGILGGSTSADESLQSVFSQTDAAPELPSLNSQFEPMVTSGSASGSLRPEPTNALGVDTIYKDLVAGNREKAVWDAVDHHLWGHAMLISSTLDKSVWKQVIQEFIRREVRSTGENTESLAALYEVFAGNFEESVDELVPPSARAGLQMVNMHSGPGPTKNALEGLNKWKETVTLILKNRSSQDHQALSALARLLASYGRTEASHVCYLLAGVSGGPILGSAHEPHASIVLLGVDHLRCPATFATDRKAVLLSEVYEFATSVLAASPSPILPHLQAFKLQHAMYLAEEDHKSEAQQYCETIATLVTSKSNAKSPLYHQRFFAELDELLHRLKQAPADGSASWISKPSMEKVSGSMWAKFNSFVSGDDAEMASNGNGKGGDGEVGPFAKIVGTPPISRSPSLAEGYGSYFPQQQAPSSSSGSRYAPNNQFHTSHPSPEQPRGRRSLDAQRSPPQTANRGYSQGRPSQDRPASVESNSYGALSNSIYSPPATFGSHSTPPQLSHAPLAPVEEIYSPMVQSPIGESPALHAPTTSFGISQTPYMPSTDATAEGSGVYTTSQDDGYQPSAYEPPSFSTGYEPPSFSADGAADEDEEEKPKKKSFMDDDDDDELMARAARITAKDKAPKNREPDELFKKALEADAKQAAAADKKGWFSGWFGKKESGPIRADLGDSNSFYFDKDLGKWINKGEAGTSSAPAATPPPPKGSAPSSRSVSAAQTPITLDPPNSRPGPMALPGGAVSAPPPGNSPLPTPPLGLAPPGAPRSIPRSVSAGAPPGPPSRPGTSLSNASSIDDLLGAPQARKAGTVKARKKGRGYIDIMAK